MTSVFENILTDAQIQYIYSLPEVALAEEKINNGSNIVHFTVNLTDEIKQSLCTQLGLNLIDVTQIPMRWIKGDTLPHIDRGTSDFETTYLMYLNDSVGEFNIGSVSYPIKQNTGFVFDEGTLHETLNTGFAPRLLLGPMSEMGIPVGNAYGIYYFSSETNALNGTNQLGFTPFFIVGVITYGTTGGFTRWRIASNSTGTSSQSVIYDNEDHLNMGGIYQYYLYPYDPSVPCFLEGTTVLCQVDGIDTYLPIEKIVPGTLVKTSRDGYKKVELIGSRKLHNSDDDERIENRLYKCSPSQYPELTTDLYITGYHSILVDKITDEQREKILSSEFGKVCVTDKKYRLMAYLDDRADPWKCEGEYTIWHLALENPDVRMNYGIYVNGTLLVETCSINFLKNHGNMKLI